MSNSVTRKKAACERQQQIAAKIPQFTHGDSSPRFVADVMLGRLAKWLRIAGFDVLYSNRFTDDELIAMSNCECRVLLSRDTRLIVRKLVKAFIFIESEDVLEQVRQVFRTMNILVLDSPLSRCISCNVPLREEPRETVRTHVPEYVYRTQLSFKSCPECGRIFWAGTHKASAVRTLQGLLTGPS